MDALTRAIEAAGGASALARILKCPFPSTVTNWSERGVPLERCPEIEAATGVRCEELRPDVQWQRDKRGTVTGYVVPVAKVAAAG